MSGEQRSEADVFIERYNAGTGHEKAMIFDEICAHVASIQSQLTAAQAALRERTEEVGRLRGELGEKWRVPEDIQNIAQSILKWKIPETGRRAGPYQFWRRLAEYVLASPPPAERAAEP